MIMEGLESVTEELSNHFLYGALKEKNGIEVLHRLMEQTIEPVVTGYPAQPPEAGDESAASEPQEPACEADTSGSPESTSF